MARTTFAQFADSRGPKLQSWVSGVHWRERLIAMNFSWFTVSMGTGVVVQNLANFPYHAPWMNRLAYCFWVLSMLMFLFFGVMMIIRAIRFPKLAARTFQDFGQTSYVGAVPITLDTILVGILIFYHQHPAAVWAAYGLWWVAVAMSVWVGCAVVFVTYARHDPVKLDAVNGVWLLSFIPFLVTSAAGSLLLNYVFLTHEKLTLVVSFMCWSLGISMCCIILTIYFWRLMQCSLPAREAIISCFIPMGPTGMGSYAIQSLANGLADFIQRTGFQPTNAQSSDVNNAAISAIAQSISWIGVIVGVFLLAFATFWFVEAIASVALRVPKKFNVGFWAFVFPVGVYSNAVCRLSDDLNNDGFRVWGAICVVATIILWLMCALGTTYRAVWRGELFFAPGLEGWNERHTVTGSTESIEEFEGDGPQRPLDESVESGSTLVSSDRSDGTYSMPRRKHHSSKV